jgi:hypothetical protein
VTTIAGTHATKNRNASEVGELVAEKDRQQMAATAETIAITGTRGTSTTARTPTTAVSTAEEKNGDANNRRD